jgi:uncharacterized protein YcaQ
VIPEKYFFDLSDDEAIYQLLLDATRSQGIGTMNDILDVHRLKKPKTNLKNEDAFTKAWRRYLETPEVVSFNVPGWSDTYYSFKSALENLSKAQANNAVLLSPFDSLVWHRPRLEEIFGMEYRIEAYTPKAQRYYGYFAMPVLVGDEIVARVDPKRNGKTLTINRVVFESNKPTDQHVAGVAKAILRAANWVNSEQVQILEVIPKSAQKKLSQLVS